MKATLIASILLALAMWFGNYLGHLADRKLHTIKMVGVPEEPTLTIIP